VGLANIFRGISAQKATGLGAVAGGFAEMGVTLFFVLAPVCLVLALVLLIRSFSRGHALRNLVAAVSLCWSAFVAVLLSLFAWLAFVHLH
jgi:hypothetical protein